MTIGSRVLLAALALASSPAWAIFANGGFEAGNFSSWTQTSGVNNGLSGVPPFTSASLNITPGGVFRGAVLGAGPDPRAPLLVLPRAGSFTAQVNHPTQAGGFMSQIAQQDVITNADRDVGDNLLHVRFSYSAVLNDSGHSDQQRPFFFVRLRNVTKSTTLFEDFTYEQQPGKTFLVGTSGYRYTQFANVDVVVPNADLGDTLEITAMASDCQPTGHPGYVYLDGFGSAVVVPGGPGATLLPIPTLSEWALILLAMLVAGAAALNHRGSRTSRM